jgi:hypothetical protein
VPANTPRGYPYPLYPDAQDFPQAIQDLAVAVDLDVEAIDTAITESLDQPSIQLVSNVNQSIVGSTPTILTWLTPAYDNDAMWNAGTPTLITFNTTGVYLLTARMEVAVSGTATEVGTYSELVTSGAMGPVPTAQSLRMQQVSPTRPCLFVPYYVGTAGETLSVRFTHDHTTNKTVGFRSLTAVRISVPIPGVP